MNPLFRKCWFLAQFLQRTLYRKEGKDIPQTRDLLAKWPELTIAEAMNLKFEMYGAEIDWDNERIFVRFRGKKIEVTNEIMGIVKRLCSENWYDHIGFDTRGIDLNAALKEVEKLAKKIERM